MDHNHFKSCTLCKNCGVRVTLDDICDLLFGQRGHFHAVRAHAVTRAVLCQSLFFIFVCHVSSGILSGMGKFHTRYRAVPLDGICGKCKCSK